MSFDLYLCTSVASSLGAEHLTTRMMAVKNMTEMRKTDGGLAQFEYNNPITGVYCLFDVTTKAELESEFPVVPDGLRPQMSVA